MIYEETFDLTDSATIDRVSEQLVKKLTDNGVKHSEAQRIRLSAEEVLLRWRDTEALGACEIRLRRILGDIHLEMTKRGNYCDPFDPQFNIHISDAAGKNILANLGVGFMFNHFRNTNYVSLTIKKKRINQVLVLLAAITAAILFGMFLRNYEFAQNISEALIEPLFDTFIGFLVAVAGPFIFISTAWGLYNMGDAGILGKIGKALFGRLLIAGIFSVIIAGILISLTIAFADRQSGTADGQFSAIFTMFTAIIPNNIVGAFLNGNPLQILFLAMLTGFILIKLQKTSTAVTSLLRDANEFFRVLFEIIGMLMPVFVFISIIKLVLSDVLLELVGIWYVLVFLLVCILIITLFHTVDIFLRMKVSPFLVFIKMTQPFLTGLFTASSIAALPSCIESCENKMGIDKKLVRVGLPLGMTFFKPCTAILYSVLVVFLANMYDISITLSGFVMLLFTSFVFSVAAPPIPNGSLAIYSLLLLQIGIPLEALVIAISANLITDFIETAFNIGFLQIHILCAAQKINMLDSKILRR